MIAEGTIANINFHFDVGHNVKNYGNKLGVTLKKDNDMGFIYCFFKIIPDSLKQLTLEDFSDCRRVLITGNEDKSRKDYLSDCIKLELVY